MGSHRVRRRKSATLRRKCDHCKVKFYSHFCLLLHLKTHLRSCWFRCNICKKPFERLARFIKHGKRHVTKLKPKRLQIANIVKPEISKVMESPLLGDVSNHWMSSSVEPEVPHSLINNLNGDGKVDSNHIKDQQKQSVDDSATSEDKVFQAAKFLEQLKALLKLDDQDELDVQDEADSGIVSHSLQVSEVTSSNMNGMADGSSGTESEPHVDCSEELGTSTIRAKTEIEEIPSHEASSVTQEAKVASDKKLHSPLAIVKDRESFDNFNAKEEGLLKQKHAAKDPSGGEIGAHMKSLKKYMPGNTFSCSLCKARFGSYSRLKRHKRVVHKLFNKAIESTSTKSISTDSQSFNCPFCFLNIKKLKSLQHHMCTTHHISRRISELWMPFSRIQQFDSDNCASSHDISVRCVSIKSGQLECNLCGASFLTFKGHKSHLKYKHNVCISHSNSDQQQTVKSCHVGKGVEKQHLMIEDCSQSGGYPSKVGQFSRECHSGYDTDTDLKCKKCESSFESVKERREHELRSHGLKVSFEGEQFAFLEVDLKVNEKDAEKTYKIGEQKKPVIDSKGKFFCKRTNSCKLCPAKYLTFCSLQRHMRTRHNIRPYKQHQNAYNEQKISISIPRDKEKLISKKEEPIGFSYPVGASNSSVKTPLSISKVPERDLGDLAKKIGAPPRDLLIYRLQQPGKAANASTSKSMLLQKDVKYLVLKVKSQVAGDKQNMANIKSFGTGEVKNTGGDGKPASSVTNKVSPLHSKEDRVQCSGLEEPQKTNLPDEDTSEIDKFLWSTNFSRKRFSCLICDASFSGYHIQRKHMLQRHDIQLDNHGNRVSPLPSADKNGLGMAGGSDSLVKGQNGENSKATLESSSCSFPSPSSPEMIYVDVEGDDSQSIAVNNDGSGKEDYCEMMKMKDGSQAYLCAYCPLQFKSMVDRLIHMNDIHKFIAAEVPHNSISQASSTLANSFEVPGKEASLPELKSGAQSLPQHTDIVKEAAKGKPQVKGKADNDTDSPSDKRKKGEIPGIFHCHLCDNIYKYYRGVYRHVRRVHMAEPISKKMYMERRFSEGMGLVENPKCHVCNRRFRAINYLIAHVKSEHSTEVGNLKAARAGLVMESGTAHVSNNDLACKRDRQRENVRSNLLAISIRDEPPSDADYHNANNPNTPVDAHMTDDGDYVPVPPCDESEIVSEDVEVVEDNFFSRLHLFTGLQQPIKVEESVSLDQINKDVGKVGKNENTEQTASVSVKREQKASPSAGKKPNTEEKRSLAPHPKEKNTQRLSWKDTGIIPKKHDNISNSSPADRKSQPGADGPTFICTIPGCSESFLSKHEYKQHIAMTCLLCHRKYSSEYNVRRHLREVHKIKETLTCDVCGKEFPEPVSLALHNKEEHM